MTTKFKQLAQGTLFIKDGDIVVVEGDLNGRCVYRNCDEDYQKLRKMSWKELVTECEVFAKNWLELPHPEEFDDG